MTSRSEASDKIYFMIGKMSTLVETLYVSAFIATIYSINISDFNVSRKNVPCSLEKLITQLKYLAFKMPQALIKIVFLKTRSILSMPRNHNH